MSYPLSYFFSLHMEYMEAMSINLHIEVQTDLSFNLLTIH